MATYHVCDVCGADMPKDETQQCFVQVGRKKTFRETNPDYDGLPHVSIECCLSCAKRIAASISAMQNTRARVERDV